MSTWAANPPLVKTGDVIGFAALTVSNLPAALLSSLIYHYNQHHRPTHLTMILATDHRSLAPSTASDGFHERLRVDRGLLPIISLPP
ncbi:hypothetical protein DD878_13590 [Staphylococcus pseudintermedius]|nr:hypothetical protein DD878_13590 [Staphylococcus pseudintermedius]